jgi:hypothetical protein
MYLWFVSEGPALIAGFFILLKAQYRRQRSMFFNETFQERQ